MCDRKNMHDKLIERAIDDLKRDALMRLSTALVPGCRDADMIELTAGMIIADEPFGSNLCNRPTSHELGQALVRANRLGLRLVKGGAK